MTRVNLKPVLLAIRILARNIPNSNFRSVYYRIRTPGKIYTGILDGLDSKWYPTWSSDGTLIAFEAELAGSDRKNEIWAVTAPEFME
ncbi:MAG: hypothetical protein L6422_12210 [Candidatus Marinimicrobia bacterium]|nr:hypothetical protein [bacterium]MCG2717009.1 hypothetical protein [Candidatus Neomarinimicrobiota bacterium]